VGLDDAGHGIGIGAILLRTLCRIELFRIANRHRLNQRALLRARALAGTGDRFLNGRVRAGRLLPRHPAVDVRAPRPGFTPVADRAVGIALLRSAKGSTRFDLREGVHQLKALTEVGLCLRIGRGDRM
jgi:hypothetical protein